MTKRIITFIMLLYSLTSSCQTQMEGWPCGLEKGYEAGVSACYASCLGEQLIMAGGANFAEKPVTEGGKKCFYKGIFAAEIREDSTLLWQQIGELPQPMAYGSTVRHGDEMIILGGINADGPLSVVYAISVVNGKAVIRELPALPMPMNDTSAAIDDQKIYIGGGQSAGRETKRVFSLCLADASAGWQEVTAYEGNASVQPVAFVHGGIPTFIGGFTTVPEAFVFDGPSGGALAQTENGNIFVAGGVNHDIFLDAISGRYQLVAKQDYMFKSPEWYQFDGRLRLYDPETKTFTTIVENKNLARVGAALVAYRDKYIFSIGGEIKPGIRSALVMRCTLHELFR